MIAYSSKEKKIPWWTSALQSGLSLPSPLPQTEGLPHPALQGKKLIWKYPTSSTYMRQAWEGNIFIADTVTIYHFN